MEESDVKELNRAKQCLGEALAILDSLDGKTEAEVDVEADLKFAADKAARTGNRKDLQIYLQLRREMQSRQLERECTTS